MKARRVWFRLDVDLSQTLQANNSRKLRNLRVKS